MNWYKKAQADIAYRGGFTDFGAHFVVFRIRDKFYSYKLSFPDWINKVQQMAKHSPGKALDWAKKNSTVVYEVKENYPLPGSIIREVGEEEAQNENS